MYQKLIDTISIYPIPTERPNSPKNPKKPKSNIGQLLSFYRPVKVIKVVIVSNGGHFVYEGFLGLMGWLGLVLGFKC